MPGAGHVDSNPLENSEFKKVAGSAEIRTDLRCFVGLESVPIVYSDDMVGRVADSVKVFSAKKEIKVSVNHSFRLKILNLY